MVENLCYGFQACVCLCFYVVEVNVLAEGWILSERMATMRDGWVGQHVNEGT